MVLENLLGFLALQLALCILLPESQVVLWIKIMVDACLSISISMCKSVYVNRVSSISAWKVYILFSGMGRFLYSLQDHRWGEGVLPPISFSTFHLYNLLHVLITLNIQWFCQQLILRNWYPLLGLANISVRCQCLQMAHMIAFQRCEMRLACLFPPPLVNGWHMHVAYMHPTKQTDSDVYCAF